MASDLEDILQSFVPKRLYDELRRDYDRILVRLGRMEEQLLMLSEYRLERKESTDVIDRKIRRAQRGGRRRARDQSDERRAAEGAGPREVERERDRPRPWARDARREEPATDLDESLADESTDELIRRLRMRYREIGRLRDRLRDEEE